MPVFELTSNRETVSSTVSMLQINRYHVFAPFFTLNEKINIFVNQFKRINGFQYDIGTI